MQIDKKNESIFKVFGNATDDDDDDEDLYKEIY